MWSCIYMLLNLIYPNNKTLVEIKIPTLRTEQYNCFLLILYFKNVLMSKIHCFVLQFWIFHLAHRYYKLYIYTMYCKNKQTLIHLNIDWLSLYLSL